MISILLTFESKSLNNVSLCIVALPSKKLQSGGATVHKLNNVKQAMLLLSLGPLGYELSIQEDRQDCSRKNTNKYTEKLLPVVTSLVNTC